jgi:hypothetical protein
VDPDFANGNKPFIFNMFQEFVHLIKRVDSGDNSRRLKEHRAFRLSTRVEKPVDNSRIALEAGFGGPIQDCTSDSNDLIGWMDCG